VVECDIIDIPRTMVRGIAKLGGTILGTWRTNPFENGGGPSRTASSTSPYWRIVRLGMLAGRLRSCRGCAVVGVGRRRFSRWRYF
jgi:hypothetical protein